MLKIEYGRQKTEGRKQIFSAEILHSAEFLG
jgi:hypothetical protein